jgi:uncharacterized paraquat-inducible protein A
MCWLFTGLLSTALLAVLTLTASIEPGESLIPPLQAPVSMIPSVLTSGIIPAQHLSEAEVNESLTEAEKDALRYCHTCHIIKSPQVKHCRYCDVCCDGTSGPRYLSVTSHLGLQVSTTIGKAPELSIKCLHDC